MMTISRSGQDGVTGLSEGLLFEGSMPTERLPMRQVREILRLTLEGRLPSREVARRVVTGSTGVRQVVLTSPCMPDKSV